MSLSERERAEGFRRGTVDFSRGRLETTLPEHTGVALPTAAGQVTQSCRFACGIYIALPRQAIG